LGLAIGDVALVAIALAIANWYGAVT